MILDPTLLRRIDSVAVSDSVILGTKGENVQAPKSKPSADGLSSPFIPNVSLCAASLTTHGRFPSSRADKGLRLAGTADRGEEVGSQRASLLASRPPIKGSRPATVPAQSHAPVSLASRFFGKPAPGGIMRAQDLYHLGPGIPRRAPAPGDGALRFLPARPVNNVLASRRLGTRQKRKRSPLSRSFSSHQPRLPTGWAFESCSK